MSFLDSLAGYAPYVAPIIERNRQRDLQAAMLKQQTDRQASQDKMAAAAGQARIDLDNARANAIRNPTPRVASDKILISQDGTPYVLHADGTYEAAKQRAEPPKMPAMPGVADPIPSGPSAAAAQAPQQQISPSQQATPPVATAPKFGTRAPLKVVVGPDGNRTYAAATDAVGQGAPTPVVKVDPFGAQGVAAKKDLQANAAKLRPTPQTPGVFVGDPNNPNAPATYKPRSEAFGGSQPQRAAGGLTGGMGAGGIGGIARTSAAITGMAQAEPRMTEFENDPKRQLDGLDYWQKMRANMYDAKGIKDEALHAAVYSHLNQTNPKLANYLRNAETWSLEDSNLSGRASDFRLKLDNFISQIGPNADDTQKATTQNFRKTRLAELQRFQPAMQAIGDRIAGGGRGGQPSPNVSRGTSAPPSGSTGDINLGAQPSEAQVLWDKAVAKYGKDKVLQQFGPRPE